MQPLPVQGLLSRLISALLVGALLAATAGAQHHLYTFDRGAAGDRLGVSVAGAGDVNNDGYPDLIVGAYKDDNNGVDSGSARVLSGKDGRVLYTFNGDSAGDWFGFSVAAIGDMNKDGYADLVVGAPAASNNGRHSGSARVLSGKDGKVLYTFNGDSLGDSFGYSVAGTGDLNNDGYPDLIVAAPADDNNGVDSGSVRIFSGKGGKVLYTLNGESAFDLFGYSVAGAGDVDRDGFSDFIAGAILGGDNFCGYARVFSGKDGKILFAFQGDSPGDLFGASVGGAGDVNKDGYPDVIVGAYAADSNGVDSGSARVFSGKDGKILYTFNGDSTADWFGRSVAAAGDVNKDGFPDLIVGAPLDDNNGVDSGSARVFSGKDGKILYTFNGDSAGDYFGVSAGGAGDVNQDAFADLIVGAYLDDNNGADSGSARVLSGKALTLTTDSHAFSLAKANNQTLSLDAGTAHNGRLYWLFGSVTGTSPGVRLVSNTASVTMPLNPDPWTDITIALANSPVLVNTKGTLDGNGKAKAQIKGGPVNVSSAIGLVLYHAYLVYDQSINFYLASNPVTLLLVK